MGRQFLTALYRTCNDPLFYTYWRVICTFSSARSCPCDWMLHAACSGMHGDGNSQHLDEPVWLWLFHAAAHCWSNVVRHLHHRQTLQERRGVSTATGAGGPPTLIIECRDHHFYFYWLICHLFQTSWNAIFVQFCSSVPSVLWHCWMGIRKSIRPVKIEWWCVGVVICLHQGADCLHMVQLMPLHSKKKPLSLASFLSRLVLPFWYRLTQVVLENRPLNGCSNSSSSFAAVKIVTALEHCMVYLRLLRFLCLCSTDTRSQPHSLSFRIVQWNIGLSGCYFVPAWVITETCCWIVTVHVWLHTSVSSPANHTEKPNGTSERAAWLEKSWRGMQNSLSLTINCLQCFDAVGWAEGRASGL